MVEPEVGQRWLSTSTMISKAVRFGAKRLTIQKHKRNPSPTIVEAASHLVRSPLQPMNTIVEAKSPTTATVVEAQSLHLPLFRSSRAKACCRRARDGGAGYVVGRGLQLEVTWWTPSKHRVFSDGSGAIEDALQLEPCDL